MRNLRLLAGLWAAGVLLRAGFLVMPHVDSDQAIFGLQAMHALGGEFPAFGWGTAYIGTAPTFLTTLIFYAFGASRLTLDVVPAIETAFWLPLTYLLGRRLAGERGGVACMALSALAPGYLVIHGAWARHGYMETVLLGTILFLLAERWWREKQHPMAGRRQVFVLGFAAGLAWWTNFLAIYFLAPIGLAVLAGLRWAAPGTFRSAAWGSVMGSLPFWIVNLGEGFPSLAMFGSGSTGHFRQNLLDFWSAGLPRLLALPVDEAGFMKILGWAVYLGFLLLLGLAVLQRPNESPSLSTGRFLKRLLLLSAVSFPAIYTASSFGSAISEFGTLRYLLPVFVLVYPLVSLGFSGERWSWARRGLMISLIAAALVSNVKEYAWAWGGEEYQRHIDEKVREERLFGELLARGLDRVRVLDFWQGPKLTFDSGERIVFAEMGSGRYPAYSRAVATAARPAFVFESDNGFEGQVRATGGDLKRERVAGYEVYHDFAASGGAVRSLPSESWRLAGQNEERSAFDRRPETKWTAPPGGGAVEIDLGRIEANVRGVALIPGASFPSRPRDVRVFVSQDGRLWEKAGEISKTFGGVWWQGGDRLAADSGGLCVLRFSPRAVRRVRIESSGPAGEGSWSLAEVFVLAASDGGSGRLAKELIAEGEEHLSRERWSEAWDVFARAWILESHDPEVLYGLTRALAHARIPDEPGRTRAERLASAGLGEEAAGESRRLIEAGGTLRGSDFGRIAERHAREERHDLAADVEREKSQAFPPLGPTALFGTCLQLDGVRVSPETVSRGDAVRIEYQWRARCPVRNDLGAFVHIDGPGESRFQDDHVPLDGAYPLRRWPAGEIVREARVVEVPRGFPPGTYKVFVGVVNRNGLHRRLPVSEPGPQEGSRFPASSLEVR